MQFLHGDSGGSPADAGGNGEHARAVIGSNKASKLAVVSELRDIGQKRLDPVEPRGIAGQQRRDGAVGGIQLKVRLQHGGVLRHNGFLFNSIRVSNDFIIP
ncbi:hypothetical protein SDC9_93896 [bioreactor metagenome]|uniref:Uncharacterized protein n=1 Tax=bioreactor metagenome TaxID=1076179 RepID=A0A645A393_9ZZZZ